MSNDQFLPFYIVVTVALLILGVYAFNRNYSECRATPHTAFYCLTSGK